MGHEHLYVHPSEIAPLARQALQGPKPGSPEEYEALAAIDQARHEDMNPPTRAQSRRRLRKHWSDRGHALGY